MNEKLTKKTKFELAKKEIFEILEKYKKISFPESDLYLINETDAKAIIYIDVKYLANLRTETRKGSAYNINRIVNILNPGTVSSYYTIYDVEKYKLITDQGKIRERLEAEKEISKNIILKRAEEKIEKLEHNSYYEKEKLKLKEQSRKQIEFEEIMFNEIQNNPDSFELRITNFKERKVYKEINFRYKDLNGKNCYQNKHLSVIYPNLLIYKKDNEDNKRKLNMEIEKFIKEGYKALGQVYFKKIKD